MKTPSLGDALRDLEARAVPVPVPTIPTPPTRSAPRPASRDLDADLHSEAITAAEDERDRLAADLADAKITADGAAAMLAAAESAWARASKHTTAEAERLERLRQEAPAVALAVADLERRVAEAGQRIVELRRDEGRTRKTARARQVYPPTIKRLGVAVRELLAAMDAEAQARMTLEREGCWSPAFVTDAALGIFDGRAGDLLRPALERWLAQAERAGYVERK